MKNNFASRFSIDDWQTLCRDAHFCELVEQKEFEAAEVRAWTLLTERNSPGIGVMETLGASEHDQAMELVAKWAKATGRTGRAHKQSRQAHIRKLMKRGVKSLYAKKMLAEAGIA